jgi:hypothetical protein
MGVTWMQKGAASANLAKQEEAAQQARKEEMGKMYRFWLKEGEEASITFVDGALSPEGFLLPPRYYEHSINKGGGQGMQHYVCPEKTNPESGQKCPICEGGDKASLVALFTIVDHRVFPSADKTKVYANRRKLLVAKSITFELLNKIALKRGGLAGATFDVSRIGDKSAAVGSMFDFTEKREMSVLEKLWITTYKQKDGTEKTENAFTVADYESEIVYRTEDELRKLGFGKSPVTGYQQAAQPAAASGTSYAEQL